jgi:hypothetical protein
MDFTLLHSPWWMPSSGARNMGSSDTPFGRQTYDRAVVDLDETTPRLGDRTRLDCVHAGSGASGQFSYTVPSHNPVRRVLVQRPVYYPFFNAIENNNAEIVSSSLILDGDRYAMDFDDFEEKAADSATTLYILCSPHNPVGRVWSREELTRVGEICLKHRGAGDCRRDSRRPDLQGESPSRLLPPSPKRSPDNAVVCTAPSKTFNLAGLHTSNIIIPNDQIETPLPADP